MVEGRDLYDSGFELCQKMKSIVVCISPHSFIKRDHLLLKCGSKCYVWLLIILHFSSTPIVKFSVYIWQWKCVFVDNLISNQPILKFEEPFWFYLLFFVFLSRCWAHLILSFVLICTVILIIIIRENHVH